MKTLAVLGLVAVTAVAHAGDECPRLTDTADHVFASAQCLDQAGDVGAAIQLYDTMLTKFPTAKEVVLSVHRAGELYAQIAKLDVAARRFEVYADRYAGENNAYLALETATRFRAALGQREKWIDNTKLMIKMYGAKRVDESARWMFDLTPAFAGDRAATLAHLRQYIAMFDGAHGGFDRIVIAHAKIGDENLAGSCPVPGRDGLCAKRVPRDLNACVPHEQVIGVLRRPNHVKLAVASYRAAITTFETNLASVRHSSDAVHWYAHAKLQLASLELERLLAQPFPKLSFATKGASDRSARRFQQYLDDQTNAGGKVVDALEGVLLVKDAPTSVAAAGRIAMISQVLAYRFLGSALPHRIDTGELGKERAGAYCDALSNHVAALIERAKEGYIACAAKANELGVLDDSARMCQRELTVEDPEAFPAARERTAKPGARDVPIATAN